jgi:hypothetical protein
VRGEFDAGVVWLAGLLARAPDIVHYHTPHAVALGTWARAELPPFRGRHPPHLVPHPEESLLPAEVHAAPDRLIAVSGSIRADVAAGIPASGSRSSTAASTWPLRLRERAAGVSRRELGLEPSGFVGCRRSRGAGASALLEAVAAARVLPQLRRPGRRGAAARILTKRGA